MKIVLHRNFKKRYKKLTPSQQHRFKERGDLFLQNSFHPLLNNHVLHYPYEGCHSINIMGDLRAVYEEIDAADTVHFVALGTHSELYKEPPQLNW